MICHFFNIEYLEVEEMPISQYRSLLEQSLNIGILISGGEFKITSEKDDRLELEWEYNELIKQGKLKHGK